MSIKKLYIIAGCNGAGKTTASFNILPDLLGCKEFVNADEIARGLSPFQPEKVSIEAGRLMLKRIDELIHSDQDFAFETTLSTKSFAPKIRQAKLKGFYVTMIFFWLESVQLAQKRVQRRVAEGGHNIENSIIERRYKAGIKNLFYLYANLVDSLLIFDNSHAIAELIADKDGEGRDFIIYNEKKYHQLKSNLHEQN